MFLMQTIFQVGSWWRCLNQDVLISKSMLFQFSSSICHLLGIFPFLNIYLYLHNHVFLKLRLRFLLFFITKSKFNLNWRQVEKFKIICRFQLQFSLQPRRVLSWNSRYRFFSMLSNFLLITHAHYSRFQRDWIPSSFSPASVIKMDVAIRKRKKKLVRKPLLK